MYLSLSPFFASWLPHTSCRPDLEVRRLHTSSVNDGGVKNQNQWSSTLYSRDHELWWPELLQFVDWTQLIEGQRRRLPWGDPGCVIIEWAGCHELLLLLHSPHSRVSSVRFTLPRWMNGWWGQWRPYLPALICGIGSESSSPLSGQLRPTQSVIPEPQRRQLFISVQSM